MELKSLNLITSFWTNHASKLDNDARALYSVIWNKWNRFGRPDLLKIDNKTLMNEANISSYKTLINKRKKLINMGLIKYIPNKTRGTCSCYGMVKNYYSRNTNGYINEDTNGNTNEDTNTLDKLNNDNSYSDLKNTQSNTDEYTNSYTKGNTRGQHNNKSNRDIENNIYIYNNARDDNISPAESQVLIFYQNRICSNLGGTPGANEIACLREYAQVYGAEQTIQALKKALQSSRKLQGIYFVKYVGGILRGWANLKIAGGESNGQLQSSNLSRNATQAQRKTGTDINWAELD